LEIPGIFNQLILFGIFKPPKMQKSGNLLKVIESDEFLKFFEFY
jgi:hypothetical protein